MRPQHPPAVVDRLATLLLGVALVAATTVATRHLLFEEGHGDPQYIHTLLDKVLP